jgi:hypothetical protein
VIDFDTATGDVKAIMKANDATIENNARLLNVDLQIKSASPFGPLREELAAALFELGSYERDGVWRARFEANLPEYDGVGVLIDEFVAVIDRLSDESRREWDVLDERLFDVGVRASVTTCGPSMLVNIDSLSKVLRVGGVIAFSVYIRPGDS